MIRSAKLYNREAGGRQLDFVECKQETRSPALNYGNQRKIALPGATYSWQQTTKLAVGDSGKVGAAFRWNNRNPSIHSTTDGSTIYQPIQSLNNSEQFLSKKTAQVLIMCSLFVST
jgi:hypothetical protein